MTSYAPKGKGARVKQTGCPVRVDATFGEPVEIVIFLASEFTVGTSRELIAKALEFGASKFEPLYGAPIRFIAAPGWTAQGIDRLPEQLAQGGGVIEWPDVSTRSPSVQPAQQATLRDARPVAFRLVQEHQRVALVAFGGPCDDEQTLLYITRNGTYLLEDMNPLIAERMGLRLGDFDNLLLREVQ